MDKQNNKVDSIHFVNELFQYPDFRHLSHEQLIQQACTATVNSASQLLTSTLVALIDVALRYRYSVSIPVKSEIFLPSFIFVFKEKIHLNSNNKVIVQMIKFFFLFM